MVFFALGILYALLALHMKIATGPYWLNLNLDPAYVYLVSGLQILVRELPGQYEHPGTPLQLLIASLISLLNMSKDWATIVISVLSDPERYLNVTWIALTCLFIVSLLSVGFYAYRLTRDFIFSLCLFVPGFIFLTFKSKQSVDFLLPVTANVSPEHLLMALGNFYVMCALFFFTRKGSGHHREAVYWGIVCGVSLMTKLTFFPLLLLPFTFLRTWRERAYFTGACILTAIVSTAPLISIYPQVLQWFLKLEGHSGWYGHGQAGFVDASKYLPNLLFLIDEDIFLVELIVVGILFLLFLKKKEDGSSEALSVTKRHWACFVTMPIISFLLVAKTPSTHYLVPAYALCGLFLGLVYRQLRVARARQIYAVMVVLSIVLLSARSVTYAQGLRTKMTRLEDFSHKVHREHPGCLLITFYRSSTIPYALFFADSWYFRNTFSAYLDKLYPESYFYDIIRGEISNYTEFFPAHELRKKYPCMMLYGSNDGDWESDMLRKIDEQEGERLYLLHLPD